MLFVKKFVKLRPFTNYSPIIYPMEKEDLLTKAEQAFEAQFGVPPSVEDFHVKTIVDGGVLFTPSTKERDAYLERERLVTKSIWIFSILLAVMFFCTIVFMAYQYRVLDGIQKSYMYPWLVAVFVVAGIAAAIDSKRHLACERLENIYTGEGKNILYTGKEFICLQKKSFPCF